tara:strand:+ start:8930 stop:9838 length:909 start_codon:yes stop_codon:yes gene_type:complete
MNRKNFLLNTALATVGTFLPFNALSKAFFRRDFSTIRRNVGVFTERGGTIGWLINDNALVAVDSQFPDSATNCISGLKERTSRKMDYLINTHHHGDHTAGNSAFKEYTEHIVAHENVPGYQLKAAEGRGQEVVDAQVTADLTFTESWKQDVGDEVVHATHYGPAHTGGDSVIYFEKANVAHMGDLVFNRVYPYIDPGAGASINNWVSVLRKTVEDLPKDTIYICGHGNTNYGVTGSKGDVLRKSDFLEELLTFTENGITAGKTKEEIATAPLLPGFEDFQAPGWGISLEFNINTAYDELIKG